MNATGRPSAQLREAVIKTASWWHGVKAAVNPETRLRARFSARMEWKLRRRERRARIRAAVREYRLTNGDERAQALKAGGRVMREQMEQARVDKETELRERFSQRALKTAPQQPVDELEGLNGLDELEGLGTEQ